MNTLGFDAVARAAMTASAALLIYGQTVHTTFKISPKSATVPLKGDSLQFVAFTRVKLYDHIAIEGFPYDRVANLYKNESLKKRVVEEKRLQLLSKELEKRQDAIEEV
jgi:hypothetical protein